MKNFLIVAVLILSGLCGYLSASQDNTMSLGASQGVDFWADDVSATSTTISAGVGDIVLLENSAREYAVITNTSASIAYLAFNATTTASGIASVSDDDYVIPLAASGGTYTINRDNLYSGQLLATSSSEVTIRAMEVN